MYSTYRTENMVNNHFYYGIHFTDEDDGYLGSGTRLKKAIKKYGKENFIRRTIKSFDTLQEALDFEALIVDDDLVQRDDCYNLCLGGGYREGHWHSDKVKEKISKANKGKKAWNKGVKDPGKTNSSSFKKGNSPWNKGIPMSEDQKRKLRSYEKTKDHRENISKSKQGSTPWNKGLKGVQEACNKIQVIQLTMDGEFIKEHDSMTIDGFSQSKISSACSGRIKSHKGYRWIKKSDYTKQYQHEK